MTREPDDHCAHMFSIEFSATQLTERPRRTAELHKLCTSLDKILHMIRLGGCAFALRGIFKSQGAENVCIQGHTYIDTRW